MAVDMGLVQAVQGKIIPGKNYVMDMNEIMAPEDGKHDPPFGSGD